MAMAGCAFVAKVASIMTASSGKPCGEGDTAATVAIVPVYK
jgi:hypothetical protein